MLCTTFGHSIVADAGAAHDHQASPSDTRNYLRQSISPGLMSSIHSFWSQDPQARKQALVSLAAGPIDSTNYPLRHFPASPNETHGQRWSVSASPSRGIKRSMTASKTSFQLAHPPPATKHRQRFNIRPRVLLQLQQISDATRPTPIYDVVPSHVFAPKLTRKFPNVFKGRDGLGADDLVIVNSQNYDSPHDSKGRVDRTLNEDSWDAREVVAAICQPKKRTTGTEDRTEICLGHGVVWEASPMSSGAYEFLSIDEEGRRTVARWVPRPPMARRRTHDGPASSNLPVAEQRRFIFSIINPDSRRHPVIATLNRSSIDISDQYSIPPALSRRQSLTTPPVPEPLAPEGPSVRFNESGSRTTITTETDERLRNLIMVTGIWVAFREGFSSNFQYNKSISSAAPGVIPAPSHKARSLSVNITSHGKGRNLPSEYLKRDPTRRTQSATERIPSTFPMTSFPQLPRSTGAAFHERANTCEPRLSTTSPQASRDILSTSSSLERVRGVQQVSQSSIENRGSAPGLSSKPTNPMRKDAWSQSSAHDIVAMKSPGSIGRKPTKLHKIFGMIRRTSGTH